MGGRELDAVGRRLVAVFDEPSLDRVRHAMGQAAKATFLDAVERDAGADRKLSGLKAGRGPTITAGYDLEPSGAVWLNMRPKGVLMLLDRGRRRSSMIRPRRRRGRNGRPPALRFGGRIVRSAISRPSRGAGTLDRALAAMPKAVTAAATAAIADSTRRELGR